MAHEYLAIIFVHRRCAAPLAGRDGRLGHALWALSAWILLEEPGSKREDPGAWLASKVLCDSDSAK